MSWPAVPVTEVARVVGGATPKSAIEDYWDGDVNWVTPKDLSNLDGKFIAETPRKITAQGLGSCAAELLPPNSVLFSSRAPIGHVAINTEPMATNQGFKSFVPGPELNSSFLYWWLDANRSYLQSLGTGATFKEVSKAVVQRIEIPLPPLEEQRRIAGILDQADTLRCLRTRAFDRLNTLGQAIFHHMFSETVFPRSIQELLDDGFLLVHKDGNHGSNYPRKEEFGDAGVPFLSAKTIDDNGGFLDGEVEFLNEQKAKNLKIGWIKAGDVLLSHNASVGKVALYRGEFGDALIGTSLTCFRPDTTKLRSGFLEFALKSFDFQTQLTANMSQTTRNQVPITAQKRLSLSIPTFEVQAEFEKRVETLAIAINRHKKAADASKALFASLQHRAFRGEL